MKLLLDTHIFLWMVEGASELPPSWRDAIRHPANDVFLSAASTWEVIVKYQLGKLALPEAPEIYFPRHRQLHRIASLSFDEASAIQLTSLPRLHRDPFDRMLICQALAHGLTLVTVDPVIVQYPVAVLM